MISIFDNKGNRKSVTWNGFEFNDPTLSRDPTEDPTGARLESVGFSTPTNFHSEAIANIVKNGGGIEGYNPHVGTRILNMRGNLRADKESNLQDQIRTMQRAFSPLLLQSVQHFPRAFPNDTAELDQHLTGTRDWPPPGGLPRWVRAYPLKFSRILPRGEEGFYTGTWESSYDDGDYLLQYHVIPLALPDPVRSSVLQGVGVDYEAQFLVMDGGRSFDQSTTRVLGDGNCAITWGRAPMWPVFSWTMDGAGAANLTIAATGTHMAASLELDMSGASASDEFEVDSRDRAIYKNGVRDDETHYVSGDFPIISDHTAGLTAIAWTNTTNVTTNSNYTNYRESDYF